MLIPLFSAGIQLLKVYISLPIGDTVVVSNEPRSIIFSYSTFRVWFTFSEIRTFRVWFIFSETYLAVTWCALLSDCCLSRPYKQRIATPHLYVSVPNDVATNVSHNFLVNAHSIVYCRYTVTESLYFTSHSISLHNFKEITELGQKSTKINQPIDNKLSKPRICDFNVGNRLDELNSMLSCFARHVLLRIFY